MATKPQIVKPNNDKAKPMAAQAQAAPQAAATATESAVIPHINPRALQKDLGPQIVRMFVGVEEAKGELERLRKEIGSKNYAAIARLTEGVYNVAMNDSNVSLADHFGEDSKRKLVLNETLYLAMGFKEVIKVGAEGMHKVDKVVWSRSVADFLPQYGEATDTPEYEKKNTTRTNLSKQLNKAIGAALDIQKRKIEAEYDEELGTLVISGPEVKKQFGVPSVALNEKQKVFNADGIEQKLLEKPSFTALYNNAARGEGLPTSAGKSNDRTKRPITDVSAAIVELSGTYLAVLKRAKPDELSQPAIDALTQIADAIDSLGVV